MFNLKIEKSMRRLFYLSFVMVALFFSACSSNTPSKAMEKYLSELQDDDLEAFVDGMSFSDKLSDKEIERQKAGYVALMSEKSSKELEKRGGIEDFEILSEEVNEKGDWAKVRFKIYFGDGGEEESTQVLVKKDGKWLMMAKK